MQLEGQTLGRYRLLRLIGIGGMGEVYLAEDPRIGQQVAVKVLRADQGAVPPAINGQTAVRLFQREARAITALDHLRILTLHDYGQASLGTTILLYFVMPYRPEGSLVEWVKHHYPNLVVPPDVVAHLLSQASEALQYAHDHQIIHSDVKPSNFLIRANLPDPTHPAVELADFGLARMGDITTTSSQAIRGTPRYIAPEQCKGEVLPASDQYALAVMAYELLTGRPPFLGNLVRLIYQHLHVPPEPPSAYNDLLPRDVDAVLLAALSKRPEERFSSVSDFAAAFQNAVQAREPSSSSPNPNPELLAQGSLPGNWTPDAVASEVSAPPPLGPSPSASQDQTLASPRSSVSLRLEKLSWESGDSLGVLTEEAQVQQSGQLVETVPPWLWRKGAHQYPGKGSLFLVVVAGLLLLALLAGWLAYAFLPADSATVLLTPAHQHLTQSFPISAVTGTPDPSKQQVGARILSATTPMQTKTVNATGQKIIPGKSTHAKGFVAIVNVETVSLTFRAGTTFPNGVSNICSGKQSLVMVLDATVTVAPDGQPGDTAPLVPAHILQVGTIGNSDLGAYSCYFFRYDNEQCSPIPAWGFCYYVASNTDFTGGQDGQTLPIVQQSDIDGAVQGLDAPSPQEILQPLMRPEEQFITAPECTPFATANQKPGDQAATVTVTVTFTCRGEVYDALGAVVLASALLSNREASSFGSGYTPVAPIKAEVTSFILGDQGEITLTVTADGVWAYHFSAAELEILAQVIAGKQVADAQRLLASQRGVAQVSLTLSGIGHKTLPSNQQHIKIVVNPISKQ
jgi:serine/threonine protein kinase